MFHTEAEEKKLHSRAEELIKQLKAKSQKNPSELSDQKEKVAEHANKLVKVQKQMSDALERAERKSSDKNNLATKRAEFYWAKQIINAELFHSKNAEKKLLDLHEEKILMLESLKDSGYCMSFHSNKGNYFNYAVIKDGEFLVISPKHLPEFLPAYYKDLKEKICDAIQIISMKYDTSEVSARLSVIDDTVEFIFSHRKQDDKNVKCGPVIEYLKAFGSHVLHEPSSHIMSASNKITMTFERFKDAYTGLAAVRALNEQELQERRDAEERPTWRC